jgi:hypothetical protein
MVVVQFQRSTLPEERSVDLNNLQGQAHAHFLMQPCYDCVWRRRRGGGSDVCAATCDGARRARPGPDE